MLPAGQLTKRATLQRFKEPADNFTQPGEWIDVVAVMIALTPLSGRELFAAQQVQAQTTHKIRMYYRGDVTTKMRLRMLKPGAPAANPTATDYRIFNIESAVNLGEANRELELLVVEEFGSPVEYAEPTDG